MKSNFLGFYTLYIYTTDLLLPVCPLPIGFTIYIVIPYCKNYLTISFSYRQTSLHRG